MSPSQHINKGGQCRHCACEKTALNGKTAVNNQEFLERCRAAHGEQYDYSKAVYMGTKHKIVVTCRDHGDFERTAAAHMNGHGCKLCRAKSSQKKWLERCHAVHGGRYDYSDVVYSGTRSHVMPRCKDHGPFSITAAAHVRGQGCARCAEDNQRLTKEDFIRHSRERHGDKYDYSQVIYVSSRQKVTIICKRHGAFGQDANNHVMGSGCPMCATMASKPALAWLEEMAKLDDTFIQHAGNGGEVRLTDTGRRYHADGYSAEHGKVYEFLGDYYHGNPRIYRPDVINKKCKRTMGELYSETCKRRQVIEEKYHYEEIWEDEWTACQTLLSLSTPRS